jgi:aminopeptidase N
MGMCSGVQRLSNRQRLLWPALLSAGLTLLLASCSGHDRSDQPLLPHALASGGPKPPEQAALDFRHADLSFRVKPDSRSIEGDAKLDFGVKAPIADLLLDLDPELAVSAIRIDGQALPDSAWRNPDGLLRIRLPHKVPAGGQLTAEIRYAGKPHVARKAPWDGGFVWARTADGKPWVGSAVESEGCDLIWPCIDHPDAEPAWVDLHITVPAGLAAPANGVLQGITDAGDGWRTFNWHARQPDTYAIAITVGPYDVLRARYHSQRYGNDVPMEFWYLQGHRAQAQRLLATVPKMVAFNEAIVGPYPWGDQKIGMVETPFQGMEHQTINAYGDGYPVDPWGFDWLLQHEFGHEWFGNQVTNRDWADMWLHEGFTQYLQPLYSQYLKGDADYYAWMHQARLRIHNKAPTAPPAPMTSDVLGDMKRGGPGEDIYFKGTWVLHTLRGLIGDKAFFQSLTELVYGRPDPRPGNFTPRYATTDDYVAIVDRITGRDLGWFFDAYLRTAALPVLEQQREGDSLRLTWKTGHGGPFPMPIEVKVGDRVETLPMADGTGTVTVPAGALVTIDPHSRVLRADPDVDAYLAYRKTHPKGPPVPPAQRHASTSSQTND